MLTICHENPEADALGSALAISLLVEAGGGVATPVCADPVPEMYDFLPGMDRFRREPDPSIDYDLIVVADCGELERVGPVLETHAELFERVPILDIDHHLSNPRFGAVDWVDPTSSATCEMVTLLAWRMGVPLTARDGMLAAALAAGVVMDTGNFQHPNVTPRTLVVAAALREAGAPLSEIARRLYRTKPNTQLLPLRARPGPDGDRPGRPARLVHAGGGGPGGERRRRGRVRGPHRPAGPVGDVRGRDPLQGRRRRTRVSVRTRDGGVDATVLTGTFGGGGHARAAGATVQLPLDEARRAVLARAAALVAAVER